VIAKGEADFVASVS